MKIQTIKNAWLVLIFIVVGTTSKAQISLSVNIAPPAMVTYSQPACPGEGYIWIPGAWAYSQSAGYYWVPGYWTLPPNPGLLWTPGYWGFVGGGYRWHSGYWGAHVGFYGGINYGFGYFGSGFNGGMWHGNRYVYNTAVTNVNTNVIHNTYVDNHYTVINNNNHVSFNGRGGAQARPNAQERQYENQKHYQPTSAQRSQHQSAMANKDMHYNNNKGQIKPQNMDRPRQNAQAFRPQHQNEGRFKGASHAAPQHMAHTGGQPRRGGGRR